MTAHRHHLERSSVTVSHPPTTRLCFHLVNESGTLLKRLLDILLADDNRQHNPWRNNCRWIRIQFRLHFLNPVSLSVFVMDHSYDKLRSAAGFHLTSCLWPSMYSKLSLRNVTGEGGGSTDFLRNPAATFKFQKPEWWHKANSILMTKNVRRHCAEFSRPGNLALGICASLA